MNTLVFESASLSAAFKLDDDSLALTGTAAGATSVAAVTYALLFIASNNFSTNSTVPIISHDVHKIAYVKVKF